MKKSQMIAWLMSIGLSKEQAELTAKNTPEDGEDVDVAPLNDTLGAHQRTLFENDPDYKKKIQDAEMAKQRDIFEAKIKKLAGLTADEVKDKKTDEILTLAFAKVGKNKDATVEEIQLKLNKALDDYNQLKDVEIPKIQAGVEEEKMAFKRETSLMKKMGGVELIGGMTAEDAIIILETKAKKLKYTINVTEDGDVEFLTEKGAKVMTDDGRTILKSDDVIANLLPGVIKKSNAEDGDKKKETHKVDTEKKNEGRKTTSFFDQNMKIAEENAESLKEK